MPETMALAEKFMEVPEFVPMFLRTSVIKFACENRHKLGEEGLKRFVRTLQTNHTADAMIRKSLNLQHDVEYCQSVQGVHMHRPEWTPNRPK